MQPGWYSPDDERSPKEQYEQYLRDAEIALPELLSMTAKELDEQEVAWAAWREFKFHLIIWNKDEFTPRYGVHVEGGPGTYTHYSHFPGDAIEHLNEFIDQMFVIGAMYNY